jgi:protein involved in polysaccharide export with SLBB domain
MSMHTTKTALSLSICLLIAAASVQAQAQPTTPQVPGPAGPASDPLSGPIRKNDIISVVISGETALSGQYRVSSEGTIVLPLAGTVRIVGLMPTEASALIATTYKKKNILINPQVVANILGRPDRTIFLAGALEKQGRVVLSDKMHLDEILEPAGILPSSDLSKIIITRGDQKLTVDYLTYRTGNDTTEGANNPLLEDGDKIYVRARVQVSGSIKINGEVRSPQIASLVSKMTVMQAIQQSGGVTELADREKIIVSRGGIEIPVSYKLIQEGQTDKDIVLQDKDEIFVRRAGTVKINGEVRMPQPVILSTKLTVAQAVQLVGGVTELADREKIIVSRGGIEIPVSYKLIQEGQTDKDIVLQDKDEIFIRRLEKLKVFYVNGGVGNRGPLPYIGKPTLTDAIGSAGGLQDGADGKKITIQRQNEKGEVISLPFSMAKASDLSAPIYPEDIINVPFPPVKRPKPDVFQLLGAASSVFFLFRR